MTDEELYKQFQAETGQGQSDEEALYQQFLNEQSNTPEIVEEMHPSMTMADRALVKNLGSDEGGFNYLQKQYPNLEFKKENGRTLMRDRGSQGSYNVLDPDTGFFSTDIINDAIDIGGDVIQGGIEGVATAGGAALGALAGGGVGAIPAGIAAGGGAGAGTEYLKQKLAQQLGVRDELSGDDIALSGAFGAASPLLFGTGATIKGAAKEGIKNIAEKGLLGTAKDFGKSKVLPSLSSLPTGVSSKVWNTFRENTDDIVKMTDEDMINRSVNVFDTLESSAAQLKEELGQQYQTLSKTGQGINLKSVEDEIFDEIGKLSKTGRNSDAKAAQELEDLYYDMFTQGDVLIDSKNVDFDTAMKIKDEIAARGDFNKALSDLDAKQKLVRGKVKGKADSLYSTINKSIDSSMDNFKELRGNYADYKTLERTLNSFKSGKGVNKSFEEKAVDAMTKLDSDSAKQIYKNDRLKGIASKLGVDIEKEANIISAYNKLRNAPLTPMSGGATTTTRSLAAAGLGGLIGEQSGGSTAIGAGAGMLLGSPRAVKNYYKLGSKVGKGSDKVKNLRDALGLKNQNVRSNIWTNLYQDENEGR